jgi:hypothetical protein
LCACVFVCLLVCLFACLFFCLFVFSKFGVTGPLDNCSFVLVCFSQVSLMFFWFS